MTSSDDSREMSQGIATVRGHAECPFGDGWRSTSWENNQDRAVAMDQWREHKKLHNRYGPIFVKEAQ